MIPRLAARLLVLPALVLTLMSCGEHPAADPHGSGSEGPGRTRTLPAPSEQPPPDLGSAPRFDLIDQHGERVTEGRFAGYVWVAGFVFTRCAGTCPVITQTMADLQYRLPMLRTDDSFRLVSFSVDPGHDTPDVLAEYAAATGADPALWTFVTGEREALWSLSKQGFKLNVEELPENTAMPILHSSMLVVVDSWGRIRGYYDGTDSAAVAELERDVAYIVSEPRRVMARPDLAYVPWLEERRQAQLERRSQVSVPTDFTFTDRRLESGIGFVHDFTPDGGRAYKPVHYDHGNGIAVADIDQDGFLDLFFSDQVGRNELWRNQGDGTFEDVTDRAGVAVRDRIGVSATFADFDSDGDPDLYVTNVRDGNLLFANDGSGRFEDVTEASGLGHRAHSSGAIAFDYDRDGRLDLLLCNVGVYTSDRRAPVARDGPHADLVYPVGYLDAFAGHMKPERYERNRIFRNEGGLLFRDVSDELEFDDASWSGDAAPCDLDDDGWPDLYLVDMQGHDQFWRNDEGRRFVRASREWFPRTSWGAMGLQVFDFDNDGDQDVYVTDMHSDMIEEVGPEREHEKMTAMEQQPESLLRTNGQSIWGNALFRNDGAGRFTEISDAFGAENYWPWGVATGDLNNDGYVDAFVTCSMNFQYRYQVNSVLLNERGERFVGAEFLLGVEPRRGGRTAKPWFRVDADGPDADHKAVRSERHQGIVEFWDAVGSRAAVVVDLDNDGDLDVVTSDFGSEPMVLVSDLTERRPDLRYVAFRLVGNQSNRDGLGAKVVVTAGDLVQTRHHDGHLGYISHGVTPLHFGLGTASRIDRVEITWPSGRRQVLGNVEVGRTHVIEEPQ